ncbi:protoheme IX farnesyltransferase [bacterium]|nr:protoheme IX farnesyltransferase [bacterium]
MKREPSHFSDLVQLTKPRICVLALLMSTLGYMMGITGEISGWHFFFTLLGIGLVGASSCIFNQVAEQEVDSLMLRTQNRPIPAHRISPSEAIKVGAVMGVLGEMILLVAVNAVTAILGAVTLLTYVGVYTPSKKTTPMSTLIGAIPGAMPPLMGWTASYGTVSIQGIVLFMILFLWQIPHFLAIAWLYKEDYARASLPILSVVDNNGSATSKQVVLYSIALLPLTLVPTVWGITGVVYLWGALALGLVYLLCGILLSMYQTRGYARLLFVVSIIYLPVLGSLMVWDRIL